MAVAIIPPLAMAGADTTITGMADTDTAATPFMSAVSKLLVVM